MVNSTMDPLAEMDRSEGGEGSSSVDVGAVNILNTRIELSVGAIHQSNAAGRRGKGERVERDLPWASSPKRAPNTGLSEVFNSQVLPPGISQLLLKCS